MAVWDERNKTSPVRILLVDDSQLMRRCLRTLLEQHGSWQICEEASNGQEAVEKAQQAAPDVIVLDFQMPKMNGLDAAREIRRRSPDVPILMVTLHMSPQSRIRPRKLEYAGHATKAISTASWKAWTPCCTMALTIRTDS